MLRIFSPHPARCWQCLDGTWSHFFPQSGTTLSADGWRDGCRVDLEVPGCWDPDVGRLVEWRGQGVARRSFVMDRPGPAILRFGGVGHTATVFVDGRPVAAHHDGHTAFEAVVAHLTAGEHDVLVHVDSGFGPASGLNIPNDYFVYGGLIRPVELHQPRRVPWLRRVDVTVTPRAGGGWRVDAIARLANPEDAAVSVDLSVRLCGVEARAAVRVAPGGSDERLSLELPATAASWSPAAPVLYWLDATLADAGGVYDGWRDRIGLREIRCEGDRLLLNGEPIFLCGVNRHEDHGEHGGALPVRAMRRDIELIRQLNANAVRTSHYPNDERFLDLCDEAGLLVWEENHARGQGLDQMRHPAFRRQALDSAQEMVEQHRNHPSIILWGVMNECASEAPEGRDMYAEQFTAIRARDLTRPTTYASCRHGNDICQDLPDVCGWNIYPQWYHDGDPVAELNGLLDRYRAPMGRKPVIVSEVGAGGIPGLRDPLRRSKWSEDGQAEILGRQLDGLLFHPRICGVFIWQFCDVRVDLAWNAIGRPGGINDKGLVDRWRRPKLAFSTVAERFARHRDEAR
ncbi:MAG: hypothetical protein FJ222_03520 [Lentisphaerae bacterium]|nr:hypothetical protein [Lentisphaerota bacterium]